jgi:membrane protein involved in colicin uptake
MAILIGFALLAFGALIWALDWSVSGAEASTIGVILIVFGAMVMLASRLVSEKGAIDRGMTEERQGDRATAVGFEETPQDETRRLRARPPQQPPVP